MKLILAGEVDRLIAEAEALQSQLDGKRAVLRLLESQLEPGSSERGRVSMRCQRHRLLASTIDGISRWGRGGRRRRRRAMLPK
jgi:hypothetical protein